MKCALKTQHWKTAVRIVQQNLNIIVSYRTFMQSGAASPLERSERPMAGHHFKSVSDISPIFANTNEIFLFFHRDGHQIAGSSRVKKLAHQITEEDKGTAGGCARSPGTNQRTPRRCVRYWSPGDPKP
ncbi:hypothetical protein BaRGS_00004705 [Batillaria attramentaria]|uniref:Uncharacterized protein n=1 Tax=Batillaria attramentaria TaxID=370345 RepID=A0ABD0LXV9_9CAEN